MEGLILALGFVGLAIAILTPLTKTGTTVTATGFLLYFYLVGLESWLPIILFMAGLLLIIMEVFIPDFGIVGILGVLSLIVGLYWTIEDLGKTIQDLGIAIILSAMIVIYLIRKGYSLENINKLILKANVVDTKKSSESETENKTKEDIIKPGLTGVTQTVLRPSGKATFDIENSTHYDVLSSEGHIPEGSSIVIEKVQGTKIVVKKEN